jgi:hypothetical protein
MQDEMAKAVAECEGLGPKLLVAQRSGQLADYVGQLPVTRRQR